MEKKEALKCLNNLLKYFIEDSFDIDGVEYILVEYNKDTIWNINLLFPSLDEGDRYMVENTEDNAIDISLLWAEIQGRYNSSIWFRNKGKREFYEPTFIDIAKFELMSRLYEAKCKFKRSIIKFKNKVYKRRRMKEKAKLNKKG